MTVLDGFTAFQVEIQETQEQGYLSSELTEYLIDYYPFDEVYATEIPVLLAGSIPITAIPPSAETHSILPGHIAPAYVEDFYNRLHLEILTLDLGAVFSEEIHTVDLWNAYFSDSILESVITINLTGLVLDLPEVLPYTAQALENMTMTVTVPQSGSAVIQGSYTFVFNTGTVILNIRGVRTILFPYCPLQSMTETHKHLTDIIPSKLGETRYALREQARIVYDYEYIFTNLEEFREAKTMLASVAESPLGLPVWSDVRGIAAVASGNTIIYFDTTLLELKVGSEVVLWESVTLNEVKTIKELYSDRIVTTAGAVNSYLAPFLAPVVTGYLRNGMSFSTSTTKQNTATLTVEAINTIQNPIWLTSETYDNLPVYSSKPLASLGISEKYSRKLDVFDSDVGNLLKFNQEHYTRKVDVISLLAKTEQGKYNLRRFINYLQGRFSAFWLPSFRNDIKRTEDITSGIGGFQVEFGNYEKFPISFIRIVGSVTRCFEVTSITPVDSSLEYLNISPLPDVDITDITQISILRKVRLTQDAVTVNHKNTNLMTIKVLAVEIL